MPLQWLPQQLNERVHKIQIVLQKSTHLYLQENQQVLESSLIRLRDCRFQVVQAYLSLMSRGSSRLSQSSYVQIHNLPDELLFCKCRIEVLAKELYFLGYFQERWLPSDLVLVILFSRIPTRISQWYIQAAFSSMVCLWLVPPSPSSSSAKDGT
jgi:hypothetical protein